MSYKTILVHLKEEHGAPALLKVAISIAQAESAHIIGFSVLPPIIIVSGIEGEGGTIIEDHREKYRSQMARMREVFLASVDKVPAVSHEWRERDCESENPFGIAATVAVAEARSVDLVVAAKDNPAWSLSGHLDLAEPLILESGRPVLVVPSAPPVPTVGKRIVVAWNGSREAARGAFDALPLLKKAEAVRVVRVAPERGHGARGDPGTFELCAALARHGVRCEASEIKGADAGAALLAAADAHAADLLVMGCYGRSRLREMILGGASRHVLQHANLPVLMSH